MSLTDLIPIAEINEAVISSIGMPPRIQGDCNTCKTRTNYKLNGRPMEVDGSKFYVYDCVKCGDSKLIAG